MLPSFPSTVRSTHFYSCLCAPKVNVGRRFLLLAGLIAGLVLHGAVALAQTSAPIVLPNTFSTVAGSSNGSAGVSGFTAGAACSPGSPYTATDIYGDGCLATQAVFGTDLQDGLRVDGQGNIWIADLNNNWSGAAVNMVRRVDAKSGIISLVSSSLNPACKAATATVAGAMDSTGDGCPFSSSVTQKERGWGMDPYGNLLTGSYTSGEVHLFCNTVSPLCPIAASVTQTYSTARKQVGYVYRLAGCVPSGSSATAGTSITAPGAGDGYFASAFENLPGDVTAWGTSNLGFLSTATITGTTGTCSATAAGELNGGRSVVGDKYGNVFIADGSNFRVRVIVGPATYTMPSGVVLTNPLPAIISLYSAYSAVTPAQMFGRIYPIFGGFPATTTGAACASATAADTFGDNCPWFNTSQAQSAAPPVGLTIDETIEGGTDSSNLILLDGISNLLHVLYMGPTVSAGSVTASTYPVAKAILANNPALTTITSGHVYLLAGNGTGVMTAKPSLGVGTSVTLFTRVAAAPNGNLYLAEYGVPNSASGPATSGAGAALYDLSTGYIRLVAQSILPVAATINVVPATTGTATYVCSTPGLGDGLPAFATTSNFAAAGLTSNVCFNNYGTGSSQTTIAADANNNLYLGDEEIDTAGYGRTRIRKMLASQLYPATIGTPVTQTLLIHAPAGTTASATAVAASALNVSSSEISVATPTCATTANADQTVDCLATVTFAPQAPGLRDASLALSAGTLSANVPLFGTATGSALVTDPSLPATPLTTNLVGASVVPVGVAVDSNGDAFTMDTAAGKFTEISGGTSTQLPGTLPVAPTQLALDLAGNLYAAGVGDTALTRLTLANGVYTATTVSIGGVTAPQAVAFDHFGNMYVADKTTASVYKVSAATANGAALPELNGTLPNDMPIMAIASGLSSPTSLAIDGYGNVYIGDTGSGSIFRVDAKSGAMTTLVSSANFASIAADTAGDVYYQNNITQTVVEIPYTSITSGVAGGPSVTVLSSLTTPSGLAVAGNGNLYSADSGAGTLNFLDRSTFSFNFGVGSAFAPTLNGSLTNVGNQAATGAAAIADSANLTLAGNGTDGCTFTSGALGPQAVGNACGFTANFVGLGSGNVSGTLSYLPAASTVGSMTLSGTLNNVLNTAVISTTSLATLAPTALPNATITLTAILASTASVAGQSVNFLNGTKLLGTGTTNASGVATYSFTTGALGAIYNFSASFSGSSTLRPSSSATQTVIIALTPTSVSLALSSVVDYPGSPVTFTATLTPAATGETISFLNGTTVLGTGTINSSGVATYVFTPTTGGAYNVTVSFPSDGKVYAASTSAAQTLTVSSSAFTFAVSPTAVSVAVGGTVPATITLTPQGGFDGTVALTCTSPVTYVTCAVAQASVAVTSNPTTVAATLTVASTTSSLRTSDKTVFSAIFAPFGLLALALGLRKRSRGLNRISMMILFGICTAVLAIGLVGCSQSTPGATIPATSQNLTFTATGAGVTQTTTVTVMVQ